MSDAHWGREVLGGIGSGDEGCSSWMGDPEEGQRSGVQACSDPLRGICCKARCHRAVGRRRINKQANKEGYQHYSLFNLSVKYM